MRILALILWISGTLAAQHYYDDSLLTSALDDYGRYSIEGAIDSLLDITDEELFTIVPRKMLEKQMSYRLELEEEGVRYHSFTIDHIGPLIHHQGVDYIPVEAHHYINYSLTAEIIADQERRHRVMRMYSKRYGEDNVSYIELDEMIRVRVSQNIYAIRRHATMPWRFLEFENKEGALMRQLIPEIVSSTESF